MYYLSGMPTVTAKVSEEAFRKLEKESRRLKTSKSELIRKGLDQLLATGKKESLMERMRDLLGSIEGPEDLSSNPKYLRDYGKSRHH